MNPGKALLGAVRFYVLLSRVLAVLRRMNLVGMGQMRVMGCFLMVAFIMMLRGLVMVARSMFVMFGSLSVMVRCFL